MNFETAKMLAAVTTEFYAAQAASFSATRNSAWNGWLQCLPYIQELVECREEDAFGEDSCREASNTANPLRVFDLGCGNLRFERFLRAELPECALEVHAVDNCVPLVQESGIAVSGEDEERVQHCEALGDSLLVEEASTSNALLRAASWADALLKVRFYERDIVGAVLDECAVSSGVQSSTRAAASSEPPLPHNNISSEGACSPCATALPELSFSRSNNSSAKPLSRPAHLPETPCCDISVAFGFMHHVPTDQARKTVLRELLQHTRQGGLAVVSFWRFMDDARLASKAVTSHTAACEALNIDACILDEGDYLLGWQEEHGAFRYCHSFSSAEIDDLCAAVGQEAEVVARFRADGKSNQLNEYLVLRLL